MRIISFALLLCAVAIPAAQVWAGGNIREADYPNQYEVMSTSKTDKLAGRDCTLTLRDRAKPNVSLNVWRKGSGSCKEFDNGKVFRGRENDKKNVIELVIPVGESKARVEEWQLIGSVGPSPA
jgi:hypothetical protein